MIVGFFLNIGYTIANFFVSLLPTVDFPSEISGALATVWGYVNEFSFIFPVGTLLTILGLAMAFHVAVMLWNLIHMVGGYIRGR